MTARYRHRTTEVEAVQWTGTNADVLRAFAGADFDEIELDDRVDDPDETAAVREADHGTWRGLKPGDWVVRLEGGLYEFSAADFASQYDPVSSAVAQSAPAKTALRDRIRRAVCEANGFDFDSDMLEPDEYGDHADMILAVLPAVADLAELTKQIDLRDYWHAEAMSATTRIIELEGQLEKLRPRLADGPPAASSVVSPVGQAAHTTRSADLLRRAESYLSALHGSVARHDNLAANLGCAGCELRDQVGAELRRMAAETQPAEAEPTADEVTTMLADATDPTLLRWGLDDVMWGDDDNVIVLMSGPDLEPYWLELDPERAAVLRRNLAGPDGEPESVAQPSGTQTCGHDDYHDPHEWADQPGVWCPGLGYADEPAVVQPSKEA